MSDLNKLELQNLRHLIGAHDGTATKLEEYASKCSDQAICDMLKKDAQDARKAKENLLTFLK